MDLLKQKENVEALLQMIKANPDLPIVPMVASECVFDDRYDCWIAEWGKAKVTKYYCTEDRIYNYDEFELLVDEWLDKNDVWFRNMTDEELINTAKEIVKGYGWTDAIIVYINKL